MSHNGILYNSGNECTAATQNNTDEPYYDLSSHDSNLTNLRKKQHHTIYAV